MFGTYSLQKCLCLNFFLFRKWQSYQKCLSKLSEWLKHMEVVLPVYEIGTESLQTLRSRYAQVKVGWIPLLQNIAELTRSIVHISIQKDISSES